jgi:hypothetical protein
MNAAIDEHCAAIGARAILVTLVRGGRARTPQSGDNSDRAAKTGLLGRIAPQAVRVPDAMSALDGWRRATIRVRGAVVTLFRGDRARTDGNDDGQCNRGLSEHFQSPVEFATHIRLVCTCTLL